MLVTIGIPFLNAEKTLPDAIRSVFAQTHQNWELILVDDGSTDGSVEIAQSIKDYRIVVVADGKNRGLSARLNQIARLAQGTYMARMDADDLMSPERIQRQLDYMIVNPLVDIIGSAVYAIDGSNNPICIRHDDPVDTRPNSILKNGFICHPTAFAKTDWFRANPYDESYRVAEDHELFCRTAHKSSMIRVSQPLLFYRETHKEPRSFINQYVRHVKQMNKCYLKYGPTTIGWPKTAELMLLSYSKVLIYKAATAMGIQGAVLKRRDGRPMNDSEVRQAIEAIETICRTDVPGMVLQVEEQHI